MSNWRRIIGMGLLLFVLAGGSQIRAQPRCIPEVVCITPMRGSRSVAFHVRKLSPGALTVRIEVKGTNIISTSDLPFVRTYEDSTETLAFVLLPKTGTAFKYQYAFRVVHGRLRAHHDDQYKYALPYAPGTTHRVVQGYNGTFSHQGLDAIDWQMPVGTPVYAARPGLVVAVSDSLREGGVDVRLQERANYILIMHADGTVASYGHLQPGSAQVAVGDTVRRRQVIARSGNTGYTSGPHLHFEVYTMTADVEKKTIPVRFDVEGAPPRGLKSGRRYRAPAH